MIRVLEVIVSLVIVALLAVVVAIMLPAHGHIERSTEVSSPLRQVYDALNTFRRFPEYSALRRLDPKTQMTLEGADSGVGSKVSWVGDKTKTVGNGSLEIVSTTPDSEVKMNLTNDWAGTNKQFTVTMVPSENGKTVHITWAYDADYGWNLMWRYAGLYIHGDPASLVQTNLNNVAAMMASFPNVDYKDQDIKVVDVTAQPILFVSTRAKRSLDEVAEATDKAMAEIEAVMKKANLHAAGQRMTITTNFGDEDYVFDVAQPVDASTIKIDKQDYPIAAATPNPAPSDTDTAHVYKPGEHDDDGNLVVGGNVRATQWYGGKALQTSYTGNAAAIPLLRLMEKAYAETHGYAYSEMGQGRFWDQLGSDPKTTAEDQLIYNVFMPIQQ